MSFTGKQMGVVLALILSAGMLILPDPYGSYRISPEVLGQEIAQVKDHFRPEILREWMAKGKRDFTIVDVRSPQEFAQDQIPGAINIPLGELGKKKNLRRLPSHQVIIVYSEGGIHGAQAWVILRGAGKTAYFLEGGLQGWYGKSTPVENSSAPQGKIKIPQPSPQHNPKSPLPGKPKKSSEEGC